MVARACSQEENPSQSHPCISNAITGGMLSCAAALLNPVGMFLVAISAAASSFGGTSGLAWMWRLAKYVRVPNSVVEPLQLSSSRGWKIGAAIVGALFVGVFGPGL